jgi:hypothetical protein
MADEVLRYCATDKEIYDVLMSSKQRVSVNASVNKNHKRRSRHWLAPFDGGLSSRIVKNVPRAYYPSMKTDSALNGPPFEIPNELLRLHYAAIQYSVRVHRAATERQERDSHISYQALAIIAMRAVTIHRAILDLCIRGWTPVTGTLVRTLADLYANTLAIAMRPDDVEFMAFRYLANFSISQLAVTSVPKKKREEYRALPAIGARW